ncbi:MAG: hypothetical protein IMW93_01245 [Thermoanaerobacteraceae bacterium]|nr:hypothetical protein [Thermoanaerobacteraceae bacterium]
MKGVLPKSFPVSLEPSLMVEKCLQSLQREIKNLAATCINQVEEYIWRVLYRGEHWEECFYNTFFSPAIMDRLTVIIKNTLERDTGYPVLYLAPDQVRPDRMDISGEMDALQPVMEGCRQMQELAAFSEAVQQWACRQVWEESCPFPLPETAGELMPPVPGESIKQHRDMEWDYLKRCITGLVGQIWRRLEHDVRRRVAVLLYQWYESPAWDTAESISA